MRSVTKAVLVSAVLLISAAPDARAADVNGDGLETILLPLAFDPRETVPGAGGTSWSGAVWIHNGSDEEVFPQQCANVQCNPGVPAGEMGLIHPSSVQGAPESGSLLHAPVDAAKRVTLSNRIFELTRRGQPRGVEIPVVREGRFLRGATSLLGVPVGADVRVALRVYDPWIQAIRRAAPPLEHVEVQILDGEQSVIGTTTLTPALLDSRLPWVRPGFAALYDLAAVFPQINAMPHIHVRVQPVPNDAEYYAMISVTDNETQTVSIITAQ